MLSANVLVHIPRLSPLPTHQDRHLLSTFQTSHSGLYLRPQIRPQSLKSPPNILNLLFLPILYLHLLYPRVLQLLHMRHETRAIARTYDALDSLFLRNDGTESVLFVAVLVDDGVFKDFVIFMHARVASVWVHACRKGLGGGDFIFPVVAGELDA